MRWKKQVTMIEAHAEGEVGRVVIDGDFEVPGKTMLEKMNYINEVDDSLRRFLVFEPRGYAQMSTNLLFPSEHPDADYGFLILQGDKAHAMSGSNCICVVTVLLEMGLVEMVEPETMVTLETPAGLVKVTAKCKDGKCESVTLNMPPAYAHLLDGEVEAKGIGKAKVDIAYGGIFYALVDPSQFNLTITPDNARRLVEIGSEIHRAVNAQLDIQHPEIPSLKGISYVMFISHDEDGVMNGATILPPGRIDRSPCGTGNTARQAVMAARGQGQIGQTLIARSIIGSEFQVLLKGEIDVGQHAGVLCQISGRGWIYGQHTIGIDPSDPYPSGYKVTDCWGDAFDLLN